jgi:hypothetical protein
LKIGIQQSLLSSATWRAKPGTPLTLSLPRKKHMGKAAMDHSEIHQGCITSRTHRRRCMGSAKRQPPQIGPCMMTPDAALDCSSIIRAPDTQVFSYLSLSSKRPSKNEPRHWAQAKLFPPGPPRSQWSPRQKTLPSPMHTRTRHTLGMTDRRRNIRTTQSPYIAHKIPPNAARLDSF